MRKLMGERRTVGVEVVNDIIDCWFRKGRVD